MEGYRNIRVERGDANVLPQALRSFLGVVMYGSTRATRNLQAHAAIMRISHLPYNLPSLICTFRVVILAGRVSMSPIVIEDLRINAHFSL